MSHSRLAICRATRSRCARRLHRPAGEGRISPACEAWTVDLVAVTTYVAESDAGYCRGDLPRAVSGPQGFSCGRCCDHPVMVLEHALLSVKPGQENDFEAAFAQAKTIIAATPGFGQMTLSRCLERPSTYLLLVEWGQLENHTVGFRESGLYQQWRQLLHHFYDPFPTVEHYEQVLSA